ncbi:MULTISPECIES: serine/threonine-protein kinase [Kitasatospora]|uniref:non-specific serine/threonine protein kinase n=1 Tax=Kitasatospora setae (strain ATCC 33774 / DSM 43861 / JCM 3304 / KCC A-0304 / NBRC 14216 / KM-6054) TaxID=452652 RepID=E4NBX2_KITSK|nr:serine/threonine-protein kinase [Kitasatospora setae]BAJ28703.1 putative serine/threonine protein kinase [Kitasatospora setae KM-6054]
MRPVGSKYVLEDSLGRGATGTVWRGRVREDAAVPGLVPGQAVAVKVLREELAADPDVVMRFLRERSVLLRLTHPNIVRTRDLVVEGELLALVMDLVDGPDLYRYLRESGPLSPIAGALLMAQIADALAASHADGVVHRDLKPANVLLATLAVDGDERMHPMLTDFGIARLADSPGITRTHEFVGTPVYVAPESAEGRPQTAAVDVYGAGIMLYELVTGRPPFQGDNPLAVLQAHLAQEPQRPRTMPEPLWTVVERCLRKDPAQRPTAVSLARALRVVAAGVGVHAAPAAVDAALAVGDLLLPDPALATAAAAGPGAGPHEATLAGVGYDPAAATQVMAHQTGAPATPGAPGAEDRTQLMSPQPPAGPPADRTRVMPSVPPGAPAQQPPGQQPPAQPEGPHPWQTQLRAARDRNAQTRIGSFEPDELGEPQVAPRPYQAGQYPQQGRQGQYGQQQPRPYPPQDGRYAPQQGPYRPQQPQQGRPQYPQPGQGQYPQQGQGQGGRPPVAPPPYQAQQPPQPAPPAAYSGQPQGYGAPQRRPEPAPQHRPEPPYREPEPAREAPREREPRRRSPNRMRIPGLGCLKGCLLVLVVLALGCLALWNFTPLPHYWDNVVGWYDSARDWVTSHT